MPDSQEVLHFWTYNDTPLEDLDRETLIEALTLTLESNAALTDQVAHLQKDVIQAHSAWRRRLMATVEGTA